MKQASRESTPVSFWVGAGVGFALGVGSSTILGAGLGVAILIGFATGLVLGVFGVGEALREFLGFFFG
jgi:hypothetical protein